LACITMTTGQKSTAVFTLLVPMICIAVPIFDTAFAIARRAATGRHPFSPDRDHIHHRLLGIGLSHRRVVWVLWYITAYLGLAGYTLEKANAPLLVLANAGVLLFGMVFIAENLSFLARDRKSI